MNEVIYIVYVLYSFSCKKKYFVRTSNLIESFKSHNELSKKEYGKEAENEITSNPLSTTKLFAGRPRVANPSNG